MSPTSLERSDYQQRVTTQYRTLHTNHDDTSGIFRSNFARHCIETQDFAKYLPKAHLVTETDAGKEKTVLWSLVMHLEMGLFRRMRRSSRLEARLWHLTRKEPEEYHCSLKSHAERNKVPGRDISSSSAFSVNRRNSTLRGSAQSAAWKVRSRPTPETVKTLGHLLLASLYGSRFAHHIAYPREEFIGRTSAMQVNIMGALREHLLVEEAGKPRRRRTVRAPRKTSGEVLTVIRPISGARQECNFV